MSKRLTVAIAGLGNRGRWNYAKYAELFPEDMQIVAVADPERGKLDEAAKTFKIPEEKCFATAEEMLECEKLADIMFICTQDRQHAAHAIPALRKGYHLMLEKPISPSIDECREILAAAKRADRHVVVCHVLRYTPFYQELKRILDSGEIGEIASIQAIENVGYYHQAHSFVRGNWRNSEISSPMILQKCCHDMDILLWLAGKELKTVSSYGDLYLFKPEKAPEGSAKRCMDGCEVKAGCPYDAEKIYITDELTGVNHGRTGWPNSVLTLEPTEDSVREALKTGPYGRCVYHCDNNVVDNQVVNLQLSDNSTISFAMCGMTSKQYRRLKVMGAYGDIDADMDTNIIKVCKFGQTPVIINVADLAEDFSGHAGGDNRMVREVLQLVRGESAEDSALTSIEVSMQSHYACLAAEYSRTHGGESIKIDEFIRLD